MPEHINIKSDKIKKIAHGQAVVEARKPLDGDYTVLSASASATAVPGEVFAGEARYLGKVYFDCLALVGDKVECVSAVAEFSDKVTSPDIATGMAVVMLPEVINVEASIEGGDLKLVAVVDTDAIATVSAEYNCLTQPDEGIYAETCSVAYSVAAQAQTETVYLTDSFGLQKAAEILFATSRAVVTNAESADGEIRVSGAVYTFAVIRTDDAVSSCRVVTPFAKSIALLGTAADDVAFATAGVTDTAVTFVEGDNRLDIAVTLTMTATSLGKRELDVVCDVFCADNEIEKTEATATCFIAEPMVTIIDTVDGQIPISADKLAADNVLCVTGTSVNVSDARIESGRVTVDGLVGGDIVYYNAEKNTACPIAFRLPFSLPLGAHTDAQSVAVKAVVTDVSVRIRRESVFDIKAEIAFTLMLGTQTECAFVESVTIGEPIPRPDATVIVHIAKPGETLWQAAKALCCSPDSVQKQNAAAAPYSGGEKLVNFCTKK